MKFLTLLSLLSLVPVLLAQNSGADLRGPQNVTSQGVIDGVVLKDEVPVRSAVQYEHVRLADYVWSKRVFSRIDAREKANHALFFPVDKFLPLFTDNPPKKNADVAGHRGWVRNTERYSLWSIIQQHLMLSQLTMYFVADSSDELFAMEDGYSFKYRLEKYANNPKESYFSDNRYKEQVDLRIGAISDPEPYQILYQGQSGATLETDPQFTTFAAWLKDKVTKDGPPIGVSPVGFKSALLDEDQVALEKAWDLAMKKGAGNNLLYRPGTTYYVTSDLITAYNIKEDWFFDKERSMLDKRIIAIAPVARFTLDTLTKSDRGGLIVREPFNGAFIASNLKKVKCPIAQTIEKEMFWLYFPELRNVMVNYYVYNHQSDAQWMSFDDFFWKRLFSAQIYKATDQFDRDIEDYRYGVDALYEAQKIKETMRTWETDLWHY